MKKFFTLFAVAACAAAVPAMAADELTLTLDWDNDDNRNIPVYEVGQTVTIVSHAEGGEAPYTYRWVDGKGHEVGTAATLEITASLPESYRLFVTSADGQTATDKANLFVNVPEVKVAGFDDLTLAPESHYAGDDLAETTAFDAIFSGSMQFTNSYMPEYSYWCGYSVANETETTFDTSKGFADQYRNAVGGGAANTANYGVSFMDYADTRIYVTHNPEGLEVPGMYVTNSAYLLNSAVNGDSYCPAFTHANNDYYKLIIEGLNEENEVTGKVEVMLVDYSAETPMIVSDWRYVDLTPLGKVCRLRLGRESSQQAMAPAYVCIDEVGAKADAGSVSAVDAQSSLRLAAQADILSVLGTEEAWTLAVYAADGTLRASYPPLPPPLIRPVRLSPASKYTENTPVAPVRLLSKFGF